MNKKSFILIFFGICLITTSISTTSPQMWADAATWTANWIWQSVDGPDNTWACFRKTFSISSVPATAPANIAADSKYWLWINGNLAVFEGGLNRGPTPVTGYYDTVDLKPYLVTGSNTVAVLVWYWGNEGRNSKDSGKGGFLFQADLGGTTIKSDSTWKVKVHPGYTTTSSPYPSYLYAGYNIGFNAQNDLPGWNLAGYDDSAWVNATQKGVPPCAPWGDLWGRPVPLWKNSGLQSYTNSSFPQYGNGTTINAYLPYAAHVTPYLKINASSAGLKIDIRTDRYGVNGGQGDNGNVYNSHRTEYTTKAGVQEFESLDWLFGETVMYNIPSGVEILELKYRETGYDTSFAGTFNCNDNFYTSLYDKAKRTLYVCMRDNFMDCPDRERGQWIGDVSSQVPQVFYVLDRKADQLVRKAISNFIQWKNGDILRGNVPGANCSELPSQSLNAVGEKGMIMNYYINTNDMTAITESYTAVKNYLYLWTMGSDGLVNQRSGDWYWFDHGGNIDTKTLENAWYYLALKSAKKMAQLTGNTGDLSGFQSRMDSIVNNFDRVLWKGDAYRSGTFTDDRANAMAVLSGLAGQDKWATLKSLLTTVKNATPYMEGYILEALFVMGYEREGLQRMKDRYQMLVSNGNSTLWEDFSILGTRNHAWSGGPLTVLGRYVAGIDTETEGYGTYHVLPQVGDLTSVSITVPSVKGNITETITRDDLKYCLDLTAPAGANAIVGIPKNAFSAQSQTVASVVAGSTTIWSNGTYLGGVSGITWNGEDSRFIKFNVAPGTWSFKAYTPLGNVTPTPTPTPLPVLMSDNFDDNSIDTAKWDVIDKGLESGASSGIAAQETNAQLKFNGTTSVNYWAGRTLRSKTAFSASAVSPLTVEVDRVSLTGSGTAYRSSVWLWVSDTQYVHVAQNIGENNWQYNVNGGTGIGTQIWNDANTGLKPIKLVHDGNSVHVYVDGVQRVEITGLTWNSNIKVMLTGQSRMSGDTVTSVFDNLNVRGSGGSPTPTPTPTPASAVLSDDFSNGLGKWVNTNNATIINGELNLTNNEIMRSASGGSAWTDYNFEADVKVTNTAGGLVFRGTDDNNYYMWQLYPLSGGKLRPHKKVNGAWTVIKEVPYSFSLNTMYHVRIEAVGSTIKTYIGGILVDTTTDTAFISGKVGFREAGTESAVFDNVLVTTAGTTPAPTSTPTPTPTATPAPQQYDYVDAGESISETAHNLQCHSQSGTSVESGYTRRYTRAQVNGSWFSYDLSVPTGVDSVKLEVRETCNGVVIKDYNIYLDGVLLEHYSYTTTGAGAYIYTRTATGLSSRTQDGKLTVKFQEEDPWQNFDASIADIWAKSN